MNRLELEDGYSIAKFRDERPDMTNVQIALNDPGYAEELGNLLSSDGSHRIYVVERPLPTIDGVVVLDEQGVSKIPPGSPDRERYVVLTRGRATPRLADLWNAGIRHVIFSGDALTVAQLAILAAEMRRQSPHAD